MRLGILFYLDKMLTYMGVQLVSKPFSLSLVKGIVRQQPVDNFTRGGGGV